MAAANFDFCYAATLAWERGKVDDPRDPGGRTADGVTQATYNAFRASKGLPRRDVYTIDPAEKHTIYQDRYWRVARGDRLPSGVDLAVYDIAVNSGPARAWSWLRECWTDDPRETVRRITLRRQSFLHGLGTFQVFGRGWMNRIADIYAKSMRLAAAAPSVSPAADARPTGGVNAELTGLAEEHADRAMDSHKAATGTLGASGAGLLAHIHTFTHAIPWWAYVGLAAAALLLAAYFYHNHLMHVAKVRALQNEILAHEMEK